MLETAPVRFTTNENGEVNRIFAQGRCNLTMLYAQ